MSEKVRSIRRSLEDAFRDFGRVAYEMLPHVSSDEVEKPTDRPAEMTEGLVDTMERELWVAVYLMEYRDQHGQIGAYAKDPGELADEAVAEYRKRYGAERKE